MAQQNAKYKRPTNQKNSVIAISILTVLLAIAIVVGATLAYFASNANASGDITLGDPVNINITQGGSTATSLTFPGNALPGTVYDQPIGVSQPESTSDSVVRAKVTITNTDGASSTVDVTTVDEWTKGDDDYYYYNGIFSAGTSHDFITTITVPTSLTNEDANKTFNVNVVVEAIQQANGAAAVVWDTAPAEWLESYVNS